MEFFKKIEIFFIQLQYCLTILPEPVFFGEKNVYSLMIKPEIFHKLINDYNIDYPFFPENKIIELKGLMIKENIGSKDALKIIENYKKQYWFLDTITMFEPVTDILKKAVKKDKINVSEKEINIELINFQKYLQIEREKIYNDLINEIKGLQVQQPETKQGTIEIKPILKSEMVLIVFEIIKDFFSKEQQPELKEILETGNNTNKKLLFKDNGNRLTDTFKKLIEHDFIIGCQKRDLINWIIINFNFTHQNKVKEFIYDTVEKTISRKDNPCKSPLIIIENRQIQKVEVPRNKKYKKW
jgi:hypothetical protein